MIGQAIMAYRGELQTLTAIRLSKKQSSYPNEVYYVNML